MFKETTKIYNEALKIIKKDKKYKENISFISLRNEMKIKKSLIKTITPAHVMDCAIKKAVSNYKSGITNFKRGYFSKYRIRYYKFNKTNNKNLYFEPAYVKKDGSITELGKLKVYDLETKKEYKIEKENIKKEFIISFKDKNYYLTIPFSKIIKEEKVKRENFISLDPGINPFLAGVNDNNSFQIGKDEFNTIKIINNRMDSINSLDMKNNKKKMLLDRLRRKIKNKIDDLHWKSINFLIASFDKILFGDMSSKSCCQGKGLSKMSKRVLNSFRFYKYKERLRQRCLEKGIEFEEVNEFCTSKTCSVCGSYKKDLGFSKIYECNKCNTIIDRDFNGARNIYFVSLI